MSDTERDNEELTERFLRVLADEPFLQLDLGHNFGGTQATIRISKPGLSSRSKPIVLLPTLVADPGVKLSEHLRMLASALETVGR